MAASPTATPVAPRRGRMSHPPISSPSTPPVRRQAAFRDAAGPSSEKSTPPRLTPPRRGSPISGGASVEERKARRTQLRLFYGLKGDGTGEPLPEELTTKGKSGDPLDIDSPAFNASAYYENLISKSTMSELMATASKLSADTGNLQSSRHALVYNHHHKLFAAGDTISHLNSRTPQLLGIMSSLQQSFSEISRLADAVALPKADDEDETRADRWRKEVERIRLMILAEEPIENIKTFFEGIREEMIRDADGNEEVQQALDECSRMVRGLSEETKVNGA